MSQAYTRRAATQMMDIVALYLSEGGTEPIDLGKLAQFAINNGHWKKSASKML